jgi:hypothetical protein
MDETKPALSSKTIWMNLAMALLGVATFFNIVPGLDSFDTNGADAHEIIGSIVTVGNLLAAYFRKTANAKLV